MINVPAVKTVLIHYDEEQKAYVCSPHSITVGRTHLICWRCNTVTSSKYQTGSFKVTVELQPAGSTIETTASVGGQTDFFEVPLNAAGRPYTYTVEVNVEDQVWSIDPIIIIDEATPAP